LIWGGKVRIISTHNGIDNPFNQFIGDARVGKRGKNTSVHRTTFRQAVAEGLYKRVCARMGIVWTQEREDEWVEEIYDYYGPGADEELDVIPSSGEGAFLSSILIESRMHDAPVLRWSCSNEFATLDDHARWQACQDWIEENLVPVIAALNPNLTHHYGMDFGRSVDLSVIAPLATEPNLTRRCPFLIELRNVPFKQQEQILYYVVDRLPRFGKGANDARGNGQQLAESAWQKYGKARVEPIMLSEEWYRQNMPPFQAAFQDAAILVPRHVDVRDDLRAFKLVKGVARIPETYKGKGSDGKPRHADAGIALVLAYYASQQTIIDFRDIQTANVPVLGANAFALGRAPDPIPVRQVGWGTTGGSNVTRGW
jgi:phage FluMu gp28-like protein